MEELVRRAREGDQEALNELVEEARRVLREHADRYVDRRFSSRFDASDVVQQTLCDAFGQIERWLQAQDGHLMPWLRKALERDVQDLRARHLAQKRSVHQTESMEPVADEADSAVVGEIDRLNVGGQFSFGQDGCFCIGRSYIQKRDQSGKQK